MYGIINRSSLPCKVFMAIEHRLTQYILPDTFKMQYSTLSITHDPENLHEDELTTFSWSLTYKIYMTMDLQFYHDTVPVKFTWLTVFAKLPWPQTVPKNYHNRTKYSWSWIQKMYLIMDVHYWKNYEPHTSYTCMLTSVPGMCCVSLVNITAVVLGAVWRSLMTELGLLFLMGFWLHTVIK